MTTELARVRFIVPKEQADALAGFLAVNVAHGWEEAESSSGETCATVHFPLPDVADGLVLRFQAHFPDGTCSQDMVPEENWVEAWKEYFTPVEGGEHFYVVAPWMLEEKAKTNRIPIIIEPKTAFGTGHHGSTSLCLEMISYLAGQGRIGPRTSFLDLGTGSGILGIACAKLGLKGRGLDIDPIAVDNALTNRGLNDVAPDDFVLACGGELDAIGPFDLVIANILAGPLMEMAPQIVSMMAGNGHKGYLILSGILDRQADAVEAVYTEIGLASAQRYTQGEWAGLLFAPVGG